MNEAKHYTEQVNQLFQAAQDGEAAGLKSLLEAHPELANTENQDGLTPLGYAAHYGQAASVQLLLEHGADVNAISHSLISFIPSNTALHAALAGERSVQVIRLLLEHGASTNIADSDGQHALHTAAFHTDQTANGTGHCTAARQCICSSAPAAGSGDAPQIEWIRDTATKDKGYTYNRQTLMEQHASRRFDGYSLYNAEELSPSSMNNFF
ncbi:ankyrin repeat domain-containing protein [Paenibacillus sp. FSL R7-0652]|uniref:ankyrin repeat domain-containing protein n=1 Tax=Paenibacillus sp. FSL R7-0652 TaxID=2921687 RepID=UPI003159F9FB